MRRYATWLLAVAALVAVLVLALDLGGDPSGGSPEPGAAGSGRDGESPLFLRGHGAPRAVQPPADAIRAWGRVEDEGGRGVGGVVVVVRRAVPYVRGPGLVDHALGSEARLGEVLDVTRSAEDGAFELANLRPRTACVVRALPEPPAVGECRDLGARDVPPRDLVLRVRQGAPLRVRVVDAKGRGLKARIAGRAARPSSHVTRAIAWSFDERSTDDDGRLHLAAAPTGRLRLDVRVPGRGSRRDVAVLLPTDGEVVIPFGANGQAVVEGRVRDAADGAVPGAWVLLDVRARLGDSAGASREHRLVASDADGRWRVAGLPAGLLDRITVQAPGYVFSDRRFLGVPLEASRATRIDVTLERGVTVTGRVTRPDGAPFQGVQLLFKNPSGTWKGGTAPGTGTDATGRYEIEGVPPGQIVVAPWTVQARGFYLPEPKTFDVLAVGGPLTVDLVLHPGITVEGRVLDPQDRPVDGVSVLAYGPPMHRDKPLPEHVPRAVTDLEGTFLFHGLDPTGGWGFNLAGGEGWAAAPPTPWLHPQVEGAKLRSVVLRVGPPARVAGRVLDAQGAGVARYKVHLKLKSKWWAVATDGAGRFAFDAVPAGTARIGPQNEHAARGVEPVELEVAWGQVIEGVTLRVPVALSVGGRVVDGSGRPLAGLRLALVPAERPITVSWQTFTDAMGRFECGDLPAGTYSAWIDGALPQPSFAAGDQGVLIVYDPPPTRVVEGRVLTPDGNPVPLGTVRIEGGAAPFASIFDGTFRLPVRETGTHARLRVSKATGPLGEVLGHCAPKKVRVDLAAGSLEIVLLPGRVLEGRVLDPSGGGAAGVTLKIRGAKGMLSPYQAVTDARGAFRLVGVPEAPVTLVVDAGEAWPDPVPVQVGPGQNELVIRLEAGGVLEGVVVSSEGRPLEGALVATGWRPKGGDYERRHARTDAAGRFRLENVPRQPQTVSVSPPTDPTPASWPWLGAHLAKVTPPRHDLRIVLEPGVWITGRVVGPTGRAITSDHVSVVALPVDRQSFTQQVDDPFVGEDRFSIGPVPPGVYALRARARSGRLGVSAAVVVRAPAEDVRLVLERRWAVTGRLIGSDVGRFVVEWFRKGARDWEKTSTVADEWGRFAIEGLPDPTKGVLFAHRSGDDRVAFVGDVDPSRDASLWPSPGRPIVGRVEADASIEVRGLVVEAFDERGIGGTGVVGEEGRFEIPGLPSGPPYTVRVAQGLVRGVRATEAAEVQAGDRGVVLRLTTR